MDEDIIDKASKTKWILRIALLMIVNLAFYLDNKMTAYATKVWGMSLEQNPLMKAVNINPWLSFAGAFFISACILWGYAKYKNENSQLFLDSGLSLVAFFGMLIILNGVLTLLIAKTVS